MGTHTHTRRQKAVEPSFRCPAIPYLELAGLPQNHGSSECLSVTDLLTFFQGDQQEVSVTHSFSSELTSHNLEKLKSK